MTTSRKRFVVKKFEVVKKWKDGGEQVIEYFATQNEALSWIAAQPAIADNSYRWLIGEWE